MANTHSLRAIVTGASRGVGRGIAEALAEAGARVVLARRDEAALAETAASVTTLGGAALAVPCDLSDDAQTEALFARGLAWLGGLDVLVNSAWGGYERMAENGEFTWPKPFWEQPLWRWDAMLGAGVRAAYHASQLAARAMLAQRRGLIVNVSFWAAQKHIANVAYGVSKAGTDKLSADCAHELRPHGIAVVSLYPGLVRTEKVMESAAFLDLSNSESPRFTGRAVVALARDGELLRRSGETLVAAALAREYGFTDVDGKQPRALSLEET
ncbi:MAG: SDR family NAD(P)-dependent oxidoreductase [Deltaproteobacteria bacterium]|nr:SDR family NAD(P)-dependent oxidoreductase [Deltaproteobacteria bacterium]